MVLVEVTKTGSESALSVIRKFSRRVQGVGLIQNARKRRYYVRKGSKTVSKKRALKRIEKRKTFNQLVKEGKVAEPKKNFRGFNRPSAPQRENTTPGKLGEDTPIAR